MNLTPFRVSETGSSFDVSIVKITSACHSLQVIETGSARAIIRSYIAVFMGNRKLDFPAVQTLMSITMG